MNDEQLKAEIMKIGLDARARLAEKLLLSLDAPSDEESLRLRVVEAGRRLKDLREGRAKEIPTEDVFRLACHVISGIVCKFAFHRTPIRMTMGC